MGYCSTLRPPAAGRRRFRSGEKNCRFLQGVLVKNTKIRIRMPAVWHPPDTTGDGGRGARFRRGELEGAGRWPRAAVRSKELDDAHRLHPSRHSRPLHRSAGPLCAREERSSSKWTAPELLLLVDESRHTCGTLCYRITSYRPEAYPEVRMTGAEATCVCSWKTCPTRPICRWRRWANRSLRWTS